MTIAKRTAITAGVLVPILIGIILMMMSDSTPLTQREAACYIMADYLKTNIQPKKVLVMANAFAQMPDRAEAIYAFHNSSIKGLQNGFGNTAKLQISYPALKPEVLANESSVPVEPQSKTPLSFLVAENAFDVQTASRPDTDLVVSLIGLPVNLKAVESWQRKDKPHYALLLPDWRMIGEPKDILAAFTSGKLVAAVIPNPGASDLETPMNKSHQEMFDIFFVLVTSNNVAELLEKQPILFRN